MCIPVFPKALFFFAPHIQYTAFWGLTIVAYELYNERELKRILALFSVIHMNLAVITLFSLTAEGLLSSITVIFGHGITSFGLFYLFGVLVAKKKARLLEAYGPSLRNPRFASVLGSTC